MCNSKFTNAEQFKWDIDHWKRRAKIKAARRALSICNKLKPSPTKARHSARIFRTLNKLRAAA